MALRGRIFVHLLVAAQLVQACSKSARPTFQNQVRIAVSSEPQTLDPLEADSGASLFVVKQLTSTLLIADIRGDFSLQDAQGYSWDQNGLKLTIRLKPGLRWSNGESIQACDYRKAILSNLDPKSRGAFSDLLFEIQGYESSWSAFDFEKKQDTLGVTCSNSEQLLIVHGTVPFSRKLISAFAFPITSPLHKDYPSVTSGGFTLYDWKKGESILLNANALFHQRILSSAFETARIQFIRDPVIATHLFNNGDIDVVDEVPLQLVNQYKKAGKLQTFPFVATYMIGFGFKKKPLDIKFRKVFSQVARQIEIETLLPTGEVPAEGWVPVSLSRSPLDTQALTVFSRETKQPLDSMRMAFKQKYKDTPLFFNSSERNKLLIERVGRLIEEKLGVKLRLEPTDWKVLLADLKSNPPQIYRFAWTAVYPDPLFFLELFLTDNVNNYGRWSNSEYDRLVKKLLNWPIFERDENFWRIFQRAHEILVIEDPAIVPLYHYVKNFLVSHRVKNWNADFRGLADLSKAGLANSK